MRPGEAARPARRRQLARVGVALAATLVAAELGVRAAARVLPDVRYLATAGQPDRTSYASLDDFLAAHSAHLIPHRLWFNYWNNRHGFNDREFEVPKPSGRFRIMALGDSFAYGLVPYPDNVLTIVEERLRADCACRNLDLLNFGVGATGVADYRTLLELGHGVYEPDLVLVHFYMGNDGPDLYSPRRNRLQHWLPSSRAATFVTNAWRLRAAHLLEGAPVVGHPERAQARRLARTMAPRGGKKIEDGQPALTDRDPAMATPTFAEEVFLPVARQELFRLYAPTARAAQAEAAWAPTLDQLESLRRTAASRGSRMVLVLYPSALQVYPSLRVQILDRVHARGRAVDVAIRDIDAAAPNRVLLGYCQRANVPCVDVTPALVDASRASSDPLYRPRDTHWNIRGNHVAAEAEAAALGPIVCRERRSSC